MSACRTLPIIPVWNAMIALLQDQLGNAVDVDAIGDKDFDEQGALTVTPPAARVFFAEESAQTFETTGENYNAEQQYGVICADEHLGPDPQQQREASLALAGKVSDILVGARIQLAGGGGQSEPLLYRRTTPLPTANTGMAYVVQISVPGIAQFPAPNAYPGADTGGE